VRGDTPIGTEETGQARLGVRREAGRLALDAALIFGIEDPEPRLGMVVGVALMFTRAFEH
jgi:hypothetical protein